jgi:hypothetical protein
MPASKFWRLDSHLKMVPMALDGLSKKSFGRIRDFSVLYSLHDDPLT